jgi:hypothetical protein
LAKVVEVDLPLQDDSLRSRIKRPGGDQAVLASPPNTWCRPTRSDQDGAGAPSRAGGGQLPGGGKIPFEITSTSCVFPVQRWFDLAATAPATSVD